MNYRMTLTTLILGLTVSSLGHATQRPLREIAALEIGDGDRFSLSELKSRSDNGVEIGNGKGVDDKGGFEIGNGSVQNDIYKIAKVLGTWRVEMLAKFTGLSSTKEEPVKTRGNIDLQRMDEITSLNDLLKMGRAFGWKPVKVGNAEGIKRESLSFSGIRELTYKLFHAPGKVVEVTIVGPNSDRADSAFSNLQKSMETGFELLEPKV